MMYLKKSFCARFRWLGSDFVRRVVWRCLDCGGHVVVSLVALFQRDYFQSAEVLGKPQAEATATQGRQ
jgi:hypothetical protein